MCYHLQMLQGDQPFFLSVRDAAKIWGKPGERKGSELLAGLVSDGLLEVAERGIPLGKKATRYRFIANDK